jgi:hypothetical protein
MNENVTDRARPTRGPYVRTDYKNPNHRAVTAFDGHRRKNHMPHHFSVIQRHQRELRIKVRQFAQLQVQVGFYIPSECRAMYFRNLFDEDGLFGSDDDAG